MYASRSHFNVIFVFAEVENGGIEAKIMKISPSYLEISAILCSCYGAPSNHICKCP